MLGVSISDPASAFRTSDPSRYRLLRRIGAGGMAEVFLAAIDGSSGPPRPVVVKRLWPELAHDEEFVDMFMHEGRLALRLDHANIVRTYEVGWHEDAYHLVMEYLDG